MELFDLGTQHLSYAIFLYGLLDLSLMQIHLGIDCIAEAYTTVTSTLAASAVNAFLTCVNVVRQLELLLSLFQKAAR